MDEKALKQLLEEVQKGTLSNKDALHKLKQGPFKKEKEHFFMPDHHRALRMGLAEVVYAESKTKEHLLKIAERFSKQETPVLFTRLKKKQIKALKREFPAGRFNEIARTLILNAPQKIQFETTQPYVAIVAAGTSDFPVLEEAAETCYAMQTAYVKVVDVGVAGLHRVLDKLDVLQNATAVLVIAGMEGALPSVVGGLVNAPLFAVPTSVGYGASFAGVSALLGMLNSCAPGISVVNIDNGFSAAFAACQVVKKVKSTK